MAQFWGISLKILPQNFIIAKSSGKKKEVGQICNNLQKHDSFGLLTKTVLVSNHSERKK